MPEGVVTWFNADKGFGFLAPDDGGADVFVHFSQLVGARSLVQGQRVAYELTQGDRGPQAAQVRQLGSGGRSTGTVTWFDVDKGFGFLAPDDGGADVFVHVTEIADDESLFALEPGERVEYELGHGDRGPQARDVRPAGAPPVSRDSRSARMARASGGGRSTGVVAWFNAEKGFGFLTPDDGSADVFVHWKAISGDGGFRTLADGQRVEYERTSGDRGPQALDVRPV